jgi:hypothetical protein
VPDDVARCHTWRHPHEPRYVVGINGEFQDVPSFLAALILNEPSAVVRYRALQNRLAPPGGPDQMIDNQVYPVFVSLVFHPRSLCEVDDSIAQMF